MSKKSYWQNCFIGSDRAKEAVKSWFDPMCEGMTPYKAEILCDIATDREKKIRAFMTDADGKQWQFERTRGGRTFSVSMKPVLAKAKEEHASGAVASAASAWRTSNHHPPGLSHDPHQIRPRQGSTSRTKEMA